MLYLLKSARTSQYLQENLHILAAPEGEVVEVDYAPRWVEPLAARQVRSGDTACLFFSDRPYRQYVPVREAEILNVNQSSGQLALSLRLRRLVHLGGKQNLKTFSQRFGKFSQGQFFVVRDPESPITFARRGRSELANWKRIIDALLQASPEGVVSPYQKSVFLWPQPICDAQDKPLSQGKPLELGQNYHLTVHYYAPGLTTEAMDYYELVVDPGSHNVGIDGGLSLSQEGDLALEVKPLEKGKPVLAIWVKPNRALSSTLHPVFEVVETRIPVQEAEMVTDTPVVVPQIETTVPEREAVPDTEVAVERDAAASDVTTEFVEKPMVSALSERHLRDLFRLIQAPDDPGRDQALLSLVDHALNPLARGSRYLAEQRALCLYRLERWKEAHQQFDSLDPDIMSPGAVVAWFVCACREGSHAELGGILAHFDAWEQQELVSDLIKVLPMVEEGRRLKLMEKEWLRAGRHQEMWDCVKDTFTRPALILDAVNLMVDPERYDLITSSQGYLYLCERMQALSAEPMELVSRAVVLGLKEPDESPDLDEMFLKMLERQLRRATEPDDAYLLVAEARGKVSDHTWASATERLADALAGREEQEWHTYSCQLYVDLARLHREKFQDLEAAEAYLTQAHLLVGDDEGLSQAIDREEIRWAGAVQRIESIRQWRDGLLAVREQQLRKKVAGKRALFVGGLERGFDVETVRTELGFSEADFVPHFRMERGSLDKVSQRIRQGQVDYLFDFISRGAHRNLEAKCRKADVLYVPVLRSRSLNQIVAALARVHKIDLDSR
jgi:tetratricopeptide (TPR) repeat protein